ncbi:putative HEAT repeat protein [Aspergillus campestris IBT 28561]|uniref:HEAT repeat protein n=1 Tax=Aspergillus campestris (strain IBT 28561) TaxID=1392248 RepID=A0A2I1CZU0_ASPC2|nr:putative HEAT repeat protein [Aspergillus campestris IBT 28561]PKY03121.1 putative HEAT repeat protein [Aspergillus campestris IBT 28561]
MVAASSGSRTLSSHRFEPFSQRVAKLKIDPVHRVRRPTFDHWSELNLSDNYSQFSRKILYHEEKIMALLPLLSLLSQFARDLGTRFEKYFAASVTLVASIAATHPEVEVVEWSFTCLAWIFKFLSRLLVPDLRQLLGIMTPYLGKERQKAFVARFAAESMSFLIRKAALNALSFLLDDMCDTAADSKNVDLYKEGLMAMFSDAMKGIKEGLHSNATDDELRMLVNILHETTADSFEPILETIKSYIESNCKKADKQYATACCRLIFVCVSTRKGITLLLVKTAIGALDAYADSIPLLLTAMAFALQLSPMDEMLPYMRPLMEAVTSDQLTTHFLSFCTTFSEWGPERFHSVVLPYFQKFVNASWKDYEHGLCLALIRLNQSGCVTSEVSKPGYITCPGPWKTHIKDMLSLASPGDADVALLNAYSRLPRVLSLSTEPSLLPDMTRILHDRLSDALKTDEPTPSPATKFYLGHGFQAYAELAKDSGEVDANLWVPISKVAARYSRLSGFLEATLTFVSTCHKELDLARPELEEFADVLITNLASPSHGLRLSSLKMLRMMIEASGEDASLVSLAIEVEESPLTLQSARVLSMHVRNLAMAYTQVVSRRWMARLIPNFLFGLFSKKMAPLWDDSAAALKTISENAEGEKIVTELAIEWLHGKGLPPSEDGKEDERKFFPAGDFLCYNSQKVEELSSTNFGDSELPISILIRDFEKDHTFLPVVPASPRTQALRVLNAIPAIAEKRSRQVIPLFLSWAFRDEDEVPAEADQKSDSDAYIPWGFYDRISFLKLLGQFLNPRVLFRAPEVHEALLGLLCHGNSEIQKTTLKALFTWKSPKITPYQENLLNILDEARFKDELSLFVRVGGDDSMIDENHRDELIPVLLRVLYGRMISKAGANNSQAGQTGRRKAILRTLSQLPDNEFGIFMQVSFGPLGNVRVVQDGQVDQEVFTRDLASPRRQTGLLKMIETVFDTLQTRMSPYVEQSMDVVLYCLVRACRSLEKEQATTNGESSEGHITTVLRNIRHTCIRCLDLVFSISLDRDWTSHVRVIFDDVINPRLEKFATENAQGVSGLLKLFHIWATAPRSSFYLVKYNDTLLTRVMDLLGVDSARDEVKVYVMDEILTPLVNLATGKELEEKEQMGDIAADEIRSEVLAPYMEHTLSLLGRLLRRGPSRPVLISGVQTLSILAPCVESSSETSSLISITNYLLRQPADRVSPKTKAGLLRILEHFLPLFDPKEDAELAQEVYGAICSMFDYFRDDANREVLSRVFSAYAKHDPALLEVAALCEDLNSVSRKRLEADYERRQQAFRQVNDSLWETYNAKQWQPLLYNMLFHTKDDEELAIRTSASYGLRRFIERAAMDKDSEAFSPLVQDVLFPSLQSGIRQKSELVRTEFVSALGFFIKLNPTMPIVQDMHGLLVGDDEEASFFTNILHVQQHRRLRALRRLAAEAAKGKLQATNISTIFIPLNEHFVFDEDVDENAHNLIAEAVATIGALSEWLDWNQFRAIFRRYRAYMTSRSEMERNILRLLGRMADALTNAVGQARKPKETDGEGMEGIETEGPRCTLARSLPSGPKLNTELTTNFTPFLISFIHHKNEAQMSLRLPASITTVKLLKLLPEQDMTVRLPQVLLDVCNILKSRSQDARDTARKTLSDISLLLGPGYFGYILKELRTTLTKGYQLHVLSFTVHSILVVTADEFAQGDLDYCLSDLCGVVMDDTFGTVGQEKDAEDYVSKMKEVKSNKSYDSMELLAKNSSIPNLAKLIRPLQSLLREKLNSLIVRKVDELLRRIGIGLLRNPAAESRDLLIFCYEVIKESYQPPAETGQRKGPESAMQKNFLINLKAPKRGEKRGTTSSYVHKLTRFALDVLRSTLNKFDSLLTPNNLTGFLPIIGDSLVQSQEEVKLSALRLLSTIVKLPLAEIDDNSHVYFTEAVKIVKEAPSTNTEGSQAALKLISALLRERKNTKLRDGHLAYLLQRLTADIEEPDRQGITFNFIRAVMARKFVVPEMYELVDHIASMMVTNQTRSARDLARGVYIHFLIEYPQAKTRWAKQLGFLAKNLEYKHADGRQSVMEAINQLLAKTGPELAQDIVGTFFLPIIMVMSNDESTECREMAGALLGEMYSRADREQLKTILTPLRSWLEQTDNLLLTTTGLQAMRIYFDADITGKEKEGRFVTGVLPDLMQPVLQQPDDTENWQTLYFSLQLYLKLSKSLPAIALAKDQTAMWAAIRECLFYPHAWVKTCAANLAGIWLADLAKANAEKGYSALPLAGSTGLAMDRAAMVQLIRASLRCLRTPAVSEELATQSVRNIIFLARCCAQNGLELSRGHTQDAEIDESEDEDNDDRKDGDEETAPTPAAKDESPTKSGLQYIFEQVSSILRREILTTRAGSLVPKTASIGLLAALIRHLEAEQIHPSLPVILLPLQHMTDASIPPPRSSDETFRDSYKALVSNCHEVLDLLQKKLGTTVYIEQMTLVQDAIKERREGRRVKRRIEAVTEPVKYEREKKRRNDRKHDKRRERGMEHRGKRRGW